MIQTIRGRIAALSLALFLGLVSLVAVLVLDGLARALEEVADRDLRAELEELVADATDRRLAPLPETGGAVDLDWSDLVLDLRDALDARAADEGSALLYEIRRAEGQLVARSPSLGDAGVPRRGAAVSRGGIAFRLERDPRPAAQGAPLRVAEMGFGPYRLQVARSLGAFTRIQQAVRAQVLAVLTIVSLLAAGGAYFVAARGLAPVRELAREAERLRTLSAGVLPRSGRGDEIDELAAVLNRMLDRVRGEVERQRRFTAEAAHELRTPLSAIRGHVEMLVGDASPEAQHVLVGVLEEVERLTRLVNQLLLLEKLEEGAGATRRERLDLTALARDLAEHLGVVAGEQRIALEVQGRPAGVAGDPEQLRRVLLNLLDNAFRHTPRGGRVWVEVEASGDRVRARVRDTGPGIPPERRERIFDRFASDRSRLQAGSGLGLPIARAIARAHGGDVRAEPSDGGAVFVLDLPAAPA